MSLTRQLFPLVKKTHEKGLARIIDAEKYRCVPLSPEQINEYVARVEETDGGSILLLPDPPCNPKPCVQLMAYTGEDPIVVAVRAALVDESVQPARLSSSPIVLCGAECDPERREDFSVSLLWWPRTQALGEKVLRKLQPKSGQSMGVGSALVGCFVRGQEHLGHQQLVEYEFLGPEEPLWSLGYFARLGSEQYHPYYLPTDSPYYWMVSDTSLSPHLHWVHFGISALDDEEEAKPIKPAPRDNDTDASSSDDDEETD